MDTHVKVVAALYIVLGSLGVLLGFMLLLGMGGVAGIVGASAEPEEARIAIPVIGVVGTMLMSMVFICSVPGLAAGIGLLYYRQWARILAIVLSAISLVAIPIGTILGGYALWVLLSKDTERLFDRANASLPPTHP